MTRGMSATGLAANAAVCAAVLDLAFDQYLSQAALADMARMTPGSLGMKVRGERPWLIGDVVRVARALGVRPVDLFVDLAHPVAA